MIQVRHLTKQFYENKKTQPFLALKDINADVEDGKITALLGPNGAGKTTLLRIIAGLQVAEMGEVLVNHQSRQAQQHLITYLSEGCGLYERLTAFENIAYFGALYQMQQDEIISRMRLLADILDLNHLLHRRVQEFSQGERMRVAIARSMIHDPQTIILDEPTNGLDLTSILRLRGYLNFLKSEEGGKKCILFSTHVMHEVVKLADSVIVISKGQIKFTGTVQEVSSQVATNDFEDAFIQLAFR